MTILALRARFFLWRQYYAFALSFYMERIAGPQPKAADGAWNHHLSLG